MKLQKVQRTALTMKEAAEYLGISYWLINQLVRKKEIQWDILIIIELINYQLEKNLIKEI